MKKILKSTIFYPLVLLKRYIDLCRARKNPLKWICIRYKRETGLVLNLKNPRTFYEKVIWLAFNTDTSRWSFLADKYNVREYVKAAGLEDTLINLYGVYDKFQDIDFTKLPKSFVIKTNNNCGTVMIVKDKKKLNQNKCRRKLNAWLKDNYGVRSGQLHYSKIVPKILVEEYLQQDECESISLIDYKFFCFHGIVKYILVICNRDLNTHSYVRQFYDLDWNRLCVDDDGGFESVSKPKSLERMIEIAKRLSASLPFVRVDLYEVNNRPYFGELTLTPSFQSNFAYNELKMGDLIDLAKI